MALFTIKDYLSKKNEMLLEEWRLFQQNSEDPKSVSEAHQSKDFAPLPSGTFRKITNAQQTRIEQSELDRIKQALRLKNRDKSEPFEFYRVLNYPIYPSARIPSPGILLLPLKYHPGRTVTASEERPETGYPVHPIIDHLIKSKYPQYINIVNSYCRPLGTTNATFNDFNREQKLKQPFTQQDVNMILPLLKHHLAPTPFQPLHFIDTYFAGMPLNTGSGYHNRQSFKARAHAKFSSPEEYKHQTTSKGYFVNASFETNRTIVHRVKYTGVPIPIEHHDLSIPRNQIALLNNLIFFFCKYPTTMYTRNHVSKRTDPLKQRPVYASMSSF